jgi:hypothetical protein
MTSRPLHYITTILAFATIVIAVVSPKARPEAKTLRETRCGIRSIRRSWLIEAPNGPRQWQRHHRGDLFVRGVFISSKGGIFLEPLQ